MADYLVTDTELTAVADAIRTKGGTSAALEWPDGYSQAVAAIPTGITPTGTISITDNGSYDVTNYASATVSVSGGGVETAHIYADLSIGGSAYYTNANGEVCTEQVDYDTGTVGINDDAIVGSLVVFYALMMPIAPPTGVTFVKQISSQKGNFIEVYEVTG